MCKKILIVEDEFIISDVLKNILKSAGYQISGIANSVIEAIESLNKLRPDFVLLDIYLKGELTGIDLAYRLLEKEIPFIYISANANQKVLEDAKVTQPYGFVIKPFRDRDVLTALDIAIYRHENNLENGLRQNAVLQKRMAEILVSAGSWEQKILQTSRALQPYLPFELFSVRLKHDITEPLYEIGYLRIGFDEYQLVGDSELMIITNHKQEELEKLRSGDKPDKIATWYNKEELEALPKPSFKKMLVDTYGFKSNLSLPLSLIGDKICYLNFYSRRSFTYNAGHLVLCNRFQPLLNSFMENMLHVENNPIASKSYNRALKAAVTTGGHSGSFEGIIGRSQLLLNVFDNVLHVSASDSSVLILGESGTGKEKIAERIFALSHRNNKPFIKVNCAALPLSLIDSVLFGHEKGAFTGAYERKTGKFEQAHTGTIFLDEIGELPLESQSKLLRVLQEREIERIGGQSPVKTDVRIITATNRNLDKEVAEGRFRLDLYYRINVFPIFMPALRDRPEDIADLVAHFLKVFNKRTGKKVKGISPQVLENMKKYHWPGNIRELENVIERNVLLAEQEIITTMMLPVHPEFAMPQLLPGSDVTTLEANERSHILAILKKCNGKIWGANGAASLLNIPPTTLNSKMKKLGINKKTME